jgi:hypothetical protein
MGLSLFDLRRYGKEKMLLLLKAEPTKFDRCRATVEAHSPSAMLG